MGPGGTFALVLTLVAAMAPLAVSPDGDTPTPTPAVAVDPIHAATLTEALGAVRFEPNVGQAPETIRFLVHGRQTAYVTDDSLLVPLGDGLVTLHFGGTAVAMQPTGGQTHRYVGADRDAWQTGIPHYGAVRFAAVAPGIDVLLHSQDGHLRFDHLVAPGADPAAAGLSVRGHDALYRDGDTVRIEADGAAMTLAAPVLYQDTAAGRVGVDGSFRIDGARIGYDVGAYDATRTLVIDPVMRHNTYIGGTATENARGIVAGTGTGSTRPVYMTGYVSTPTIPGGFTSFPQYSGTFATATGMAGNVAFVAKFTYDHATRGVTLNWYALLGGTLQDQANDIDIMPNGNVVISGMAYSKNFPIANHINGTADNRGTYDGSIPGDPAGCNWPDGFVALLNPIGILLMSSFYGGGGDDASYGVAALPSGDIALTGYTQYNWLCGAVPFPLRNAVQLVHADAGNTALNNDPYVARISMATNPPTIGFSTLYGGAGEEFGHDVSADALGNIFVVGETMSAAFPTTAGAFMTAAGGKNAFVAKFRPAGTVDYATVLGGTSTDAARRVDTDNLGNAWVVGETLSTDFPVCGATGPCSRVPVQATNAGGYDAFVTAVNPAGSGLYYSTYLGGGTPSTADGGFGIAFDRARGMVHVVGETQSASFPTNGQQPATHPTKLSTGTGYDGFYARIEPTSNTPLNFSTYVGGTGTDALAGVDVDDLGAAYAAGWASSGLVPLNPAQPVLGGGTDAMMTIFAKRPPTASLTANAGTAGSLTAPPTGTLTVPITTPVTFTAAGSTGGDYAIDWPATQWAVRDGATTVDTGSGGPVATFVGAGSSLVLTAAGTRTVCVTVRDVDTSPYDGTNATCLDVRWAGAPPDALFNAPSAAPIGTAVSFADQSTDDLGIVSWAWTFGDGVASTQQNPTHTYLSAGTYTVSLTVTDTDGMQDTYTTTIQIQAGPVALCAPDTSPIVGQSVTLQDLSIAGDQPILTWQWDLGDGSTSSARQPTHTYGLPGTYTVTLTVTDSQFTDSGTCQVTVLTSLPTPQPDSYIAVRDTTLDVGAPGVLGNDLDPLGTGITAQLATSPSHGVALVQPDGSFLYIPAAGFVGIDVFTYQAVGLGPSDPATVTITVQEARPPTAAFQFEQSGRQVQFWDVSQPGDAPIVQWDWVFGDGTTSTTRNPLHTLPGGRYVVSLTVTDARGLSSTAFDVVVTPKATQQETLPDGPPVADAGPDAQVQTGQTVVLTGHATGQARTMHYEWVQTDGPPVTLLGARTQTLSFIAPAVPRGEQVVLTFALLVHNGIEYSEADLVHVIVGHVNRPPVAAAPRLVTAEAGRPVELDASLSTDPDGDNLTFAWTPRSGTLSSQGAVATFTGDVGNHIVHLRVSDGAAEDSLLIEIRVREASDAPQAFFDVVLHGHEAHFVDRSTGGAQVTWHFGDGNVSHAPHPVHVYEPGTHEVRLVVMDDDGDTDVMERVLVVSAAPTTPPPSFADEATPQSTAAATPLLPGLLAAAGAVAIAALLFVVVRRFR